MKVLIIQTAFLGDAVLSTSLAEALHHHFPQCRLDVLVRKGNESLFEQHPFIHKIFVWDKKQNKFLNLFKLISQIRREHYDEVINIQRFFSSGLLTVFSGAKTTSGFVKNPLSFFFSYRYPHLIGNGVHETKRNLSLISHLVKAEGVKPCLYPAQKDFDAVQRLVDSPYVCMAPASVWFTKQLPVPKWVELIQQVKEKFNVVLIGGKDDVRMGEEIIQHTGRGRVMNLAGKLSLLQTAALMKHAAMNYVNDSAPLHIASSVNAPVTAFFLSTLPEFGFGPLSENSKIIHAVPVPPCRPCGLHGKKSCPEKHFHCAMQIQINHTLLP